MIDFSKIPPDTHLRFLPQPEPFKKMFFIREENKYAKVLNTCPADAELVIKDFATVEPKHVTATQMTINAIKMREPAEWETVTVPLRHKKRSNQSETYHARISKKWLKRGLTVTKTQRVGDPVVLQLPRAVVMRIASGLGSRGAKVHGQDLHLNLDLFGLREIVKRDTDPLWSKIT